MRVHALVLIVVAVLGPPLAMHAASDDAPAERTSFVELDVVALDKRDRPVSGLQQADFTITEDGRRVDITSFKAVDAAGISGNDDRRVVSLLLDDNSVALNATTLMRNIAELYLSLSRPMDSVSVVRLTHAEDEAAGSLPDALDRIDAYHTGSLGFFGRTMFDDTLITVGRVARQLASIEHRRKVLVCVGSRDVCDPYFEAPETTLFWKSWQGAIAAAARANASVYNVSPAGVIGRLDLGGGLADTTGGAPFVRSNDFARAAKMIWDEASHYYLLGYVPVSRPRPLHEIKVSLHRSDLHVRARRERGD